MDGFEIFEVRETREEESRFSSNGPIRTDRRSAPPPRATVKNDPVGLIKSYLRTSPAVSPYRWSWREIAHRNIVSDVCHPTLDGPLVLRCRSVRKMAYRNIVSKVVDFILPHPYPPNHCTGRPLLFHWTWHGLAFGRSGHSFHRRWLHGFELSLLSLRRSWWI